MMCAAVLWDVWRCHTGCRTLLCRMRGTVARRNAVDPEMLKLGREERRKTSMSDDKADLTMVSIHPQVLPWEQPRVNPGHRHTLTE